MKSEAFGVEILPWLLPNGDLLLLKGFRDVVVRDVFSMQILSNIRRVDVDGEDNIWNLIAQGNSRVVEGDLEVVVTSDLGDVHRRNKMVLEDDIFWLIGFLLLGTSLLDSLFTLQLFHEDHIKDSLFLLALGNTMVSLLLEDFINLNHILELRYRLDSSHQNKFELFQVSMTLRIVNEDLDLSHLLLLKGVRRECNVSLCLSLIEDTEPLNGMSDINVEVLNNLILRLGNQESPLAFQGGELHLLLLFLKDPSVLHHGLHSVKDPDFAFLLSAVDKA